MPKLQWLSVVGAWSIAVFLFYCMGLSNCCDETILFRLAVIPQHVKDIQ